MTPLTSSMAHGFVSYSQPKYGLDLGAMVAGKIKDSLGVTAGGGYVTKR